MVSVGLLLALLASVFFGGNHAAARRGLVKGDVYSGVLLTFTLGLPIFFTLAWSTGELGQLPVLPLVSVAYFLLAGILHFAIGRTLTYVSLQQIGTTRTSPLVATNTLYTVALGISMLGEPAALKVVVSALLVVSGVVLISRQEQSTATDQAVVNVRGLISAIIAGFIFGVTPLLVRAGLLLAPLPALAALLSYAVATLLYLPPLLLPTRRQAAFRAVLTPAFLVAAASVNLGQLFRYYALNLAPASVASTVINAFPVFTLLFAYPGRRGLESYSPQILSGAALVLVGVTLLYVVP